MRARSLRRLVAALLGVLLLAACTGDGEDDTAAGGAAQEGNQGPVKLSFWAWAPNLAEVVKIWNQKHPDIQVTVSEQAGGDDLVTQVLTANKAGNPPDLMQAEYQALPTLVTNEVVADLSEDVGDVADSFSEETWRLVTLGTEAVYGIPQDTGPMMLYYRQDLFDQMGLTVPTTWEEFARLAREVRQKDPKKYLTTFSSTDPGWFAGLSQQAGAQWWTVEGDAWRVTVGDQATRRVAEFWGGLVAEGVIDDQPMYTPEWNKALNDGTLLAWPSAVWGPGVLEGTAPNTKGKWAMAPLPQWTAGEQRTGFWGGSSTAVAAKSPHREQALEFATWLNTDPEAVEALVRQSNVYPAATAAQTGPALQEPPAFFANQPDFYQQAAEIAQTAAGFTWGPNVNVTYSTYNDAFGRAVQRKSSFVAAVEAMQKATLDDLRGAGFSVAE